MNECQGVWGCLFGHDFRPRYSIEGQEHSDQFWSSFATTFTATNTDNPEVLKSLRQPPYKKTYECDICARCGKVVRKTDVPPEAAHD